MKFISKRSIIKTWKILFNKF